MRILLALVASTTLVACGAAPKAAPVADADSAAVLAQLGNAQYAVDDQISADAAADRRDHPQPKRGGEDAADANADADAATGNKMIGNLAVTEVADDR